MVLDAGFAAGPLPGGIVVMDKLGSHTGGGRARGHRGRGDTSPPFPPPYGPDFNPIENALAKPKAMLRKAAERTAEGLLPAIGRLIGRVTPAECRNYFAAAGLEPGWRDNVPAAAAAVRG